MKGIINSRGELLIKRANITKPALCPISAFLNKCSDKCALFREPITNKSTKKTSLQLCYGTSSFSEFDDKRYKQQNDEENKSNETNKKEENEK